MQFAFWNSMAAQQIGQLMKWQALTIDEFKINYLMNLIQHKDIVLCQNV